MFSKVAQAERDFEPGGPNEFNYGKAMSLKDRQ